MDPEPVNAAELLRRPDLVIKEKKSSSSAIAVPKAPTCDPAAFGDPSEAAWPDIDSLRSKAAALFVPSDASPQSAPAELAAAGKPEPKKQDAGHRGQGGNDHASHGNLTRLLAASKVTTKIRRATLLSAKNPPEPVQATNDPHEPLLASPTSPAEPSAHSAQYFELFSDLVEANAQLAQQLSLAQLELHNLAASVNTALARIESKVTDLEQLQRVPSVTEQNGVTEPSSVSQQSSDDH